MNEWVFNNYSIALKCNDNVKILKKCKQRITNILDCTYDNEQNRDVELFAKFQDLEEAFTIKINQIIEWK